VVRIHTNIPDGEYTVHRGSADCGLLVSEALVRVKEGSMPLLLLNVSPTDLAVLKGTRLASLTLAEMLNTIILVSLCALT
jgi:hypothetical protein